MQKTRGDSQVHEYWMTLHSAARKNGSRLPFIKSGKEQAPVADKEPMIFPGVATTVKEEYALADVINNSRFRATSAVWTSARTGIHGKDSLHVCAVHEILVYRNVLSDAMSR